MNQRAPATPAPASTQAPEPWSFSSTESRFSGQFLLRRVQLLHDWLNAYSSVLSFIIGLIGMLLVGLTWGGFWAALEKMPTHGSEAAVFPVASSSPSISVPGITSTSVSAQFKAHIAGAVRKPGVYELSSQSVVQDLVTMAGGLSGLVWQDYLDEYINLAAPLSPNQKVWIPSLAQQELLESALESESVLPASSLEAAASVAASESSSVSINSASVAELDTLTGIGLKRAEDIASNRPYAAIEELTSKAGVPASIVAKLKNQLKL